MIEDYKNKVSYLEILVYRLNNLISYFLENSDEATNLYKDYKAKQIDKDIKKDLERLKESEEYHRKGYAELYKRIDEAIEYIEENETTFNVHNVANEFGIPTLEFTLEPWKKELLDILKGVEKE